MEENNKNPETGGKTFSQEDVNRIVSDRLARERDRLTAELDEREKELKAKELDIIAKEKLTEAGLNKELYKLLRYDNEEELENAVKQLSSLSQEKKEEPKAVKKFLDGRLPQSSYSYDPSQELRKAMGLH